MPNMYGVMISLSKYNSLFMVDLRKKNSRQKSNKKTYIKMTQTFPTLPESLKYFMDFEGISLMLAFQRSLATSNNNNNIHHATFPVPPNRHINLVKSNTQFLNVAHKQT